MPIAGQNWPIELCYAREGHEHFFSRMDISLAPDSQHVEIAMTVSTLIADALRNMQIREAEVDDGFEVVINISRSR